MLISGSVFAFTTSQVLFVLKYMLGIVKRNESLHGLNVSFEGFFVLFCFLLEKEGGGGGGGRGDNVVCCVAAFVLQSLDRLFYLQFVLFLNIYNIKAFFILLLVFQLRH